MIHHDTSHCSWWSISWDPSAKTWPTSTALHLHPNPNGLGSLEAFFLDAVTKISGASVILNNEWRRIYKGNHLVKDKSSKWTTHEAKSILIWVYLALSRNRIVSPPRELDELLVAGISIRPAADDGWKEMLDIIDIMIHSGFILVLWWFLVGFLSGFFYVILWWLKEDGHHGSMIKDPAKNVGQTTDFSMTSNGDHKSWEIRW